MEPIQPNETTAPQEIQGDYSGDYDDGQFELTLILESQQVVFVEGTIRFDLVEKRIVPIELLNFGVYDNKTGTPIVDTTSLSEVEIIVLDMAKRGLISHIHLPCPDNFIPRWWLVVAAATGCK